MIKSDHDEGLTALLKDDLKGVGGGLVGFFLAGVNAGMNVAILPTYIRTSLEERKELSDEIAESEAYKPTRFEQAVAGVFSAVEPPLRYLVAAGILGDLADGKVDNKANYFFLIPMGISLLYEGIRYARNRSVTSAPVTL